MDDRAHDAGKTVERAAEFELEPALAKWRAGFTALSGAELDELADHLREEFARLVALGLAPDESWWLAQRRLGANEGLEREFAKVTVHRPLFALVLGYLAVALSLRVLESLVGIGLVVSLRLGQPTTATMVAAVIAGVLLASVVLARLLPRVAVDLPRWALRSPRIALGLLLAGYVFGVPGLYMGEGSMVTLLTYEHILAYMWSRNVIEIALVVATCALAWFVGRRTPRRAALA
jgi:hypothetical protein